MDRATKRLKPSLRPHLAALALYTLLALFLTWPLVTRFTSHVPGDGIDDPALAWNLWWIKARLLDQLNPDIFHADWMFFPIGINLGFYTLTPLNGLLSLPLQTSLSLVVANNLLLLSSFVLSGYGAFLLVGWLLRDRGQRGKEGGETLEVGGWKARARPPSHSRLSNPRSSIFDPRSPSSPVLPALFAGLVYAFAAPKLFYASLGQFNIASSQWIPFAVLAMVRMAAVPAGGKAGKWIVLAGLFLAFQAWAELTYASFLVLFAALLFAWKLLELLLDPLTPSRPGVTSLVRRFAGLGLLFVLGLAPFLWAMIPDLLREGDFFASGGGFADVFSADLLGYLMPTRLHPLFGAWVAGQAFPNDKGQQITLGYTLLVLSILGGVALVRRQGGRGLFWPLAGLLFWWLTLGDVVRWNGQPTGIPGPFALIRRLPFFSGNRYPSRYSVMLLLSAAVLAGYALHWAMEKRKGRWQTKDGGRKRSAGPGRPPVSNLQAALLFLALAVLFLFEHISIPLPLNDFRTPAIYREIQAQPGDFTLLELPTGWRNGARVLGRSHVLIMMQQWRQTVHGKRRLGGNTSRNPPYKFQYFTQAPLLGDLIALMNGDAWYLAPVIDARWEELVARNRPLAGPVLDFLNVGYVTLHLEQSPPPLVRFVEEVLPVTLVDEWRGPDWTGAPSTIRLYRVETKPATAWSLELGQPQGALHLGEGWATLGAQEGRVRFALRREPRLLLDLPDQGGQLTLILQGKLDGLALNGRPLAWQAEPLPDGAQRVAITVPPGWALQPVDELALAFAGDPRPGYLAQGEPGEGGWPVGDTGLALPQERPVLALSAGADVGDFARIFLAGQDVSPNRRGYNLVALDSAGQLLEATSFDTFADPQASQAMAAWLEQWPAGTVIAGAVRDEASRHLGPEAVAGLARLGLRVDLQGRFRWSHAFVGVVGAPGGSGVEQADVLGPAAAWVGSPVDGPWIFGGVERVIFRAAPTR